MIRSVLVANRGEIALRVFRTCRELGIATVAVHSDADARARHVREADAAVRLPGDAPADTYLRGDLIVAAARAAGADAVHPGYGFLSEDPEFARAVRAAGLVWVGPPSGAMKAMASKTRAKRIAAEAGVPVLAPFQGDAVRAADLPVLVKAAAGGGGRGMRVVRELALLDGALEMARAESAAAFGDGEVFVEPYVEGGRHVEVQVLADAHGTVWTLGTRDCSLQRRHQKVIEEAPAPALPVGLADALCAHAAALAKSVGYVGAGTVEFLLDGRGRAWFLEMNTRLQVEHPVTECVYGVDLVALQLRIAEGGRLAERPPEPVGHAVEARLYAEDPARDWRPWTGTVHALEVPEGDGLRVDPGVGAGDAVGPHYDALLAKVVAHAPDRPSALHRLARALERARVHGPVTNRDLLVGSLRHPEFAAGTADTGFYGRHLAELVAARSGFEKYAALAAALADAQGRSRFGGWRNVPSGPQVKRFRARPGGEEHEVRYRIGRDGLEGVPGVRLLEAARERVALEIDGVRRPFEIAFHGTSADVDSPLGSWSFTLLPRLPEPAPRTEPGSLLAPMPGTVVRIADGLAPGDRVEAGQVLLWVEAMKMEHRVTAPDSGTLTALHAAPGRRVATGDLLAVVVPPVTVPPAVVPHEPAVVPHEEAAP
ncbi:acetyl/propionyl/methylcrotonyl-CoA carboxylase subunit alpha [Streptomyces luteireticuli]|uniref:Biotin carboxylase N-terminal domain-containing protein n=1 Tax=Streptomyces luteireticuli TaxID=173858 RepID=A0ABP3IRS6_9ACTN